MATQAIEQETETATDAASAAPKKGKRGVLILAIAGVAAGAAAGLFGVAPMLSKRHSTAAAAPKAEAHVASVTEAIENLVLNPAGSGGTRFLMVTASFELKDEATKTIMKEHEAEVRDKILALLGKKTVEELSDFTQRDRIKNEVLDVVSPVFPPKSVYKVFFSQFVIQ
jgi:flagellar FliL protein